MNPEEEKYFIHDMQRNQMHVDPKVLENIPSIFDRLKNEIDNIKTRSMNLREQFEKETGLTTGIMFAHSVGFRDEYVIWLEKLVKTLSSNPEPTREELVEQAEQFLVGKSLMEYLPELMADFHIEMKKGNQ